MKLAFVLGKNHLLSIAEILAYYNGKEISPTIISYSKEILLLDTELPNIYQLGGTIKVIKIEQEGTLDSIDLNQLFPDVDKKTIFGISMYGKTKSKKKIKLLATKLQKEQKAKGNIYKAFIPPHGTSLTHVEVLKKNLLDTIELIIFQLNGIDYVGRTIQVHNPFAYQQRDIDRPVQRTSLSIPPRLANILINLTSCETGTLLDPFCGIGTILQEAALHNFKIKGVDINSEATNGARKNLEWLKETYNIKIDYNLITTDSRKLTKQLKENSIDCIATEPDLGPLMRERPHYKKVEKILTNLTDLYLDVFKEFKKVLKPGSRIAMTSPAYQIGKKQFSIDFQKLAKKTGFKLIDPLPPEIQHELPLTDYEKRHITIREIHVLEKP